MLFSILLEEQQSLVKQLFEALSEDLELVTGRQKQVLGDVREVPPILNVAVHDRLLHLLQLAHQLFYEDVVLGIIVEI